MCHVFIKFDHIHLFFLVSWAAAASYYNNFLNFLLTTPPHLLHHLTHWFPYRQAGSITHRHPLTHTLLKSTFILHFISFCPKSKLPKTTDDIRRKLIWKSWRSSDCSTSDINSFENVCLTYALHLYLIWYFFHLFLSCLCLQCFGDSCFLWVVCARDEPEFKWIFNIQPPDFSPVSVSCRAVHGWEESPCPPAVSLSF